MHMQDPLIAPSPCMLTPAALGADPDSSSSEEASSRLKPILSGVTVGAPPTPAAAASIRASLPARSSAGRPRLRLYLFGYVSIESEGVLLEFPHERRRQSSADIGVCDMIILMAAPL